MSPLVTRMRMWPEGGQDHAAAALKAPTSAYVSDRYRVVRMEKTCDHISQIQDPRVPFTDYHLLLMRMKCLLLRSARAQ
jgi:hypothetical protein